MEGETATGVVVVAWLELRLHQVTQQTLPLLL